MKENNDKDKNSCIPVEMITVFQYSLTNNTSMIIIVIIIYNL